MRKLLFLIAALFLFIPHADAGTIFLDDEGTNQGVINKLKCAGAGISCSKAGLLGTVTITGGASSVSVEDDDVLVDSSVIVIDVGNGLTASSSPAGEANISVDGTDSLTITGDWDFGGGGIEIENGTTPPACTVGQIYLDTDATSGQQLMACEGGTFVKQGDGTGGTPAFSSITGGTNTTAAMVVGTGASLAVSGSGTIAATTAAALAADPANCSAGSLAAGVTAAGVAEGCTDVWTEAENTAAGYISATLTQEQVEDYAGALVTDGTGTHTGIDVTYQDATGDVDFVVDMTEFNTLTLGSGTFTTLTIDAGVTDPVFTFGSDSLVITNVATLTVPNDSWGDAEVADNITASSYLPLAGGTMTGSLVTDNLGIEFEDSDTNPTCGAGEYKIYADLSETTFKKCMNGSATDLDTTGGTPAFSTLTGGTNTTAAMVVGSGATLSATGTGTITANAVDAVGAAGITIGSADVTALTVTTDSTGTAEVALPAGAIDGTEILDDTITFDDVAHTITLAGNPALGANEQYFGANGIIFEGSVTGGEATVEGLLQWSPTTSDRTVTIPDATFTIPNPGSAVTLTGNWVNTTNPWAVDEGGTGAATFTANGALYGNGTSAVQVTAAHTTNGSLLIGDGSGVPTVATLTSGTGTEIAISNGAGSITLDITADSVDHNELAATLTFSDADYVDLSAILHNDTALQGLRLPQIGAAPSNPVSGEGFIGWDETNNTLEYYNGSAWAAVGAASFTDLDTDYGAETITSDFDFGGGTLQVPNSTSLPGTCEVGDSYMDTDATSGSRWYLCETANSWVAQGGGGGGGATNKDLPIYSAKLTGAFTIFTPTSADACTAGAQIDAGEGNWRLLFGSGASSEDHCATWQFVIPSNYASGPTLDVDYSMTSATTGTVEFEAGIMCVSPDDAADIGTASFAAVAVASETLGSGGPGTAGHMGQVTITLTDDSCAAGDIAFIVLSTDANDATNDTATGNREVVGVDFNYTGS